jgi:putative hydrolase of the HAD superfamily
MLRGILLDFDDTLVPQADFLAQAWHHVARFTADRSGVDVERIEAALHSWASRGSDRGHVIDHALADAEVDPLVMPHAVACFQAFRATELRPYPGVIERLVALRSIDIPVVVVTDGNPGQQRSKVAASGVGALVTAVVVSDDLGREFRKPHAAPFDMALTMIEAPPRHVVMIGDRPDKDIVGAARLGMHTIRVLQGEHVDSVDVVRPSYVCESIADALDVALHLAAPQAVA